MGTAIGHHGLLFGGGGATSYNSVVAAAAPNIWWRLDENSGTTATDSASPPQAGGTLTGGATFASSGVSIAAPSGYAGLGNGINLSAASVTDVRTTTGASGIMVAGAGLSFTTIIWVAGSSGSNQYLVSRINQAAIIYNFVADTVEFFASGFTGSDPRTGSQISLPASDTTTPHMIAYTYDAATSTWAGYKDGAQVFSVTRTFGTTGGLSLYLGSDSSTNVANSRVWDHQQYKRALSATEIANIYAARNNP